MQYDEYIPNSIDSAMEVLANKDKHTEKAIATARRIKYEYTLNPGYFDSEGVATQPADLGSKFYMPTPEEVILIEQKNLEIRMETHYKRNQLSPTLNSRAVEYFINKAKEE